MRHRERRRQRTWLAPVVALCFHVGLVGGWWLRGRSELPPPAVAAAPEALPVPTSGSGNTATQSAAGVTPRRETAIKTAELNVPSRPDGHSPDAGTPKISADPIAELRNYALTLPVDGARIDDMKGDFAERRDRGTRGHEAVDLLAPRHTPVKAVEDGIVARLFTSKAGGLAIYQFDPRKRFCFYYAHLDRYAAGLREGQPVTAGQVIGYVGTTGNAPPDTPHLHFAIFELTPSRRWWEGKAIDPYMVYRAERPA